MTTDEIQVTSGAHAKPNARARVLLIEDNARLRKLMADVLELEGFAVTTAADAFDMRGQMSIQQRENYPDEPFDLIITDVQMPGENGLAVLEWYRRRGCSIPALVVTAFPDSTKAEQVKRLDATLLAKPFSLHEFRIMALATLNSRARPSNGE